jgi:hypothetical protein
MTVFYSAMDERCIREMQAFEIKQQFGRDAADDEEHDRLWKVIVERRIGHSLDAADATG